MRDMTFPLSRRNVRPGFTSVELLVVVAIISLLVAILLPAITSAMDEARVAVSRANLRNLAAAHRTYAADWNDHQFTLIADTISAYGDSAVPAFDAYSLSIGRDVNGNWVNHAPIRLGWGYDLDGHYGNWIYSKNTVCIGNYALCQPIEFADTYIGSFRLWNCGQFNQYVAGKFYDRSFYAPKDTVVVEAVKEAWDDPGDYSFRVDVSSELGMVPAWPSYCLSPAAMFNPEVMEHDDANDPGANGWQDPWSLKGGFRSPGFAQALYPSQKTHMLEHHWLQNRRSECNPAFDPGTYDGCEPYYFNHSRESVPVTLFYDGHVGSVGVREAIQDDARMRTQTGQPGWGLWCTDTPFGVNGYLIPYAKDFAATSFHILTTDGIRGRDALR